MNVSASTTTPAQPQNFDVTKPDPQPSTSFAAQAETKPDAKSDAQPALDTVAISSAAQDQWQSATPERYEAKPEANSTPSPTFR